MGVLDDLRRKAEEARQREAEQPQLAQSREDELRAVALPALFRIHRRLSELVAHLKDLQQESPATLTVSGIGAITGLAQGQYELSAEGKPPEVITLRCTLRHEKARPLELKTQGSITQWLEGLRKQGLTLKVLRMVEPQGPVQKAYVGIDGVIPVTLQFKMDVEAFGLQFFVRNFDELAERRQFFNPASVTEQWCEELLKFVLREENSFMRQDIAPDVREQLRRRLEWEKLKEQAQVEALEPRLATTNRLKGLFKRTPQLKVQYGDRAWDVAGKVGPFTLGRVTDCDIQVKEQRVSRFHARIELRDDYFEVIDDSTNGTQVRFQDGRIENLKGSSVRLTGSGLIALGTEATEANPHVIYFLA